MPTFIETLYQLIEADFDRLNDQADHYFAAGLVMYLEADADKQAAVRLRCVTSVLAEATLDAVQVSRFVD